MNEFLYKQDVLFRHCDPAGIMFFPRILEIVNDAVEDFFEQIVQWSFADIHPDWGVPTAEINTRFVAACRLSESLTLSVKVAHLGKSSLTLKTVGRVENETRFKTTQTVVCIGPNKKPVAWPDRVRGNLKKFIGDDA